MTDINDLNNKLKKIQKDIKEYQKACNHKNQAMKMNDKNEIQWRCLKCDSFIRIPTQEEVTKWLK
tara:strand:+ start:972 stop:1166 length:195 start_codon:yes stop_codon:yes gene_type:complete